MLNVLGNIIFYISIFFVVLFYTGWIKRFIESDIKFIKIIYFINTFPFILLMVGFIISDFSILNVLQNSYIDDPLYFKITSTWGSHEGSILLWFFIINLFGILFARFNKIKEIHKHIIFISSLFLLYILISSNPFVFVEINENIHGLGLNPILQHFLFTIHPPTLFIGYVGLIIPFVLACHMLIKKNFINELFQEMLFWSKISWFFLTLGIVLGSYWAYAELGWGGWWFWDPVENISLIPWLLCTALIHSLQVSIKNNQLKLWSLNLGLYCFIAAVFGTFLVRSNLIISVHSFATDPLRGLFLIIIISYLLAITIKLNLISFSYFNEDSFKLVSRESFLLLNNVFLICAALTVFVGTIYPLFSEMIINTTVSVGAPYYNFAFNIFLSPIILFMAFAPQIKWGQHQRKNNQSIYILLIALTFSFLTYLLLNNIFFAISILITTPLIIKSFLSLIENVNITIKFISQWLAHLSIGIFIIAAVFTEQFDTEQNIFFEKGQLNEITLNNKSIAVIKNIQDEQYQNFKKISVDILIIENNHEYLLSPSKHIYQPSGQVTNEVSMVNKFLNQYYATINSIERNQVSINLVYKPLINLLWLSAIMLVFSIFLSLIKRK